MPSPLHDTLRALADRFVEDIIAALSKTLDTAIFDRDGSTPARAAARPTARPTRRRRMDLASVTEQIASALAKTPGGVRAEELRSAVGLDKARFVRGVRKVIADKKMR